MCTVLSLVNIHTLAGERPRLNVFSSPVHDESEGTKKARLVISNQDSDHEGF